jgi:glycosyltransferase involved in cell wall biosynthesis
MTRVAGVIAAHNQERYIREAVLSLRAEVDELVVVDDGSRDGTSVVLADLEGSADIRVLRHDEPRGVSVAYNHAVESVDADVLLIQGGDDVTLPGRRAASVAALADASVTLVHSLPRVIDGAGSVLPDEAAGEFFVELAPSELLSRLFNIGNYVCAPSAAVRRVDYVAAGGFPPGIDLLQDYALWLELAVHGAFHRTPEPLVEYRKHGSNLSREYVGVDSDRRRRYFAELAWIRDRFVDRASADVLHRLRPLPPAPPDGEPWTRDELALLLRLGHSDRPLVRRGLADLFDLAVAHGDEGLKRLGLTRRDLDRLASIADHEGLGQLGRVRAIARDLGRPIDA